jgi:predicted nucleic acid-binding protein
MPAGPVILNNTPLVALWLVAQLSLLRDLYGQVVIPAAVQVEFLAIERLARQQALDQAHWIQVRELTNPQQARVYVGLDQGEAEVLALALEQSASLVVIDERRGRRYAQRLGLPLTGTLGLLLLAKEKGLITAVTPLLKQLQTGGLYFEDALIAHTLELAGEA